MILLHLIGNAILLWLGYYWLGVGESTIPRLVWSAAVVLALICGALVVHGAALTAESPVRPAVARTARHLGPLVVLAMGMLVVYGLFAWWRSYSDTPAFSLASWLTLHLRRPVKPGTVASAFNGVLCVVRWMVVPCLALPLAASIARDGWSGLGSVRLKRAWWYWAAVPVLLVCALWVPLALIAWVPHVSGFSMEMASLVVRMLAGYGLFVVGLLGVERVVSLGNLTGRSVPSTGS